jgi:hypothetical protein
MPMNETEDFKSNDFNVLWEGWLNDYSWEKINWRWI